MTIDGRIRTRQDRWAVVFLVFLAVLAAAGFEVTLGFLVALMGAGIGRALAYIAVHPFRRSIGLHGRALNPFTTFFLGLVSTIVVFVGALLVGVTPSTSMEVGGLGEAVFGFALGFGVSLRHELSLPPPQMTPEDRRETRRSGVRFLLLAAGAATGLFTLLFAVFVLFEHVLDPIIRYFAQ